MSDGTASCCVLRALLTPVVTGDLVTRVVIWSQDHIEDCSTCTTFPPQFCHTCPTSFRNCEIKQEIRSKQTASTCEHAAAVELQQSFSRVI